MDEWRRSSLRSPRWSLGSTRSRSACSASNRLPLLRRPAGAIKQTKLRVGGAGRPPKSANAGAASSATRAAASRNGHVGLHDEIIAVIRERGPSTAAELAIAIRERGRYQAPRSGKPLDAATVNSRVSNPVYRARFRRAEGRISLAD